METQDNELSAMKNPFNHTEENARQIANQMFTFINPNKKPYLEEQEVLEILKMAYNGMNLQKEINIDDISSFIGYHGGTKLVGKISYEEFEAMVVRLLSFSEPNRNSLNLRKEENENIKQNLKTYLNKAVGKEAVENELKAAMNLFVQYDVNKSGYLEEEEVPQILIDTYMTMGVDYQPTDIDVENYINLMDLDGDGKISRTEYEIFMLKALEKRGIHIDNMDDLNDY